MELVKLTHENLEREHICCAISGNKDIQVMSKKNWLKDRLDEGLVFLKGNVRGKCFIEYIPAEYAWRLLKQKAICTLTACGYPGSSRGMDTRTCCWKRASRTVKRKEKRGL